ncbi:hypothetical protein ACFWU3_06965 [Streptomyces sp. NPDC058685]
MRLATLDPGFDSAPDERVDADVAADEPIQADRSSDALPFSGVG